MADLIDRDAVLPEITRRKDFSQKAFSSAAADKKRKNFYEHTAYCEGVFDTWSDVEALIARTPAVNRWMPMPELPEKIGDYDAKKQVAESPTLDVSLNVYASLEPFGDTGSAYHDRWICTNCHRTCRSESWGTKCDYERCPHCGAIIGE